MNEFRATSGKDVEDGVQFESIFSYRRFGYDSECGHTDSLKLPQSKYAKCMMRQYFHRIFGNIRYAEKLSGAVDQRRSQVALRDCIFPKT